MAKSRKTTKSTRTATANTKVRRVQAEEDRGSLLRGLVIIALLVLGLYLIYTAFGRDIVEDVVTDDEQSKTDEAKDDAKSDDEKSDEEKAADAERAQQAGVATTTVNETETAYEYTVGEGESYTTMARRAIASVAGDLSGAERVAAETKLAQDADAAWLSAGQDLSLTKDNVRAAVDWAKGLSDEQKAAWQPYADMIAW